MRLKKYPYNSIREEKRRFIDVLFFLFTKNSIDIGLAVSCISVPKKVLIFDDKNIFIGFDSVVFCISIQIYLHSCLYV